jgi:hypothetical protein
MKSAREVLIDAAGKAAVRFGRPLNGDPAVWQEFLRIAAEAIEAARASRGTREREAGTWNCKDNFWCGWRCEEHKAVPAEPPTGHLEVAVRALEAVIRVIKAREAHMEASENEERFQGSDDTAAHFSARRVEANLIGSVVGSIIDRALADLRAAKGTP